MASLRTPWDVGFRSKISGFLAFFHPFLALQHPQRSWKDQTTLSIHLTTFHWAWNRPLSQCLSCKPLKILVLKPNFGVLGHFFGLFQVYLPWNPLLTALSALSAHNVRIWARFYNVVVPLPLGYASFLRTIGKNLNVIYMLKTSCNHYIQWIYGWIEDIHSSFLTNT